MATKKKGGKKRAVDGVGKSAVAKLGPAPGVPALPKVDIDLGIGKIGSDLEAARKEGKSAAKGQLASIDERMARSGRRQSARYDQRTDKIMRNMKRLDRQTRLFSANRQAGINATNQNIMRNSTYGSGGGGLDVGITGSRATLLKSQGRQATTESKAGKQAGKSFKKAGQKAVDATPKIQMQSSKNSMSILDVLAAERKSDDIRFLSELEMQEKQMELSQAHDLRMATMNFQNDLYMQKYSQALNMDYMDWQYKRGYLETPDQQRAEEYKIWKMQQDYLNNIETKKDNNGQYKAFSRNVDVAESTVAAAATVMTKPKYQETQERIRAAHPEWPESDVRATAINELMHYEAPQDMKDVSANIVNVMAQTQTTPTFSDVQELIGQVDPTGKAAKYINSASPARMNRIHQNYRALNAAVLGTEEYKDVSTGDMVQTDPSVLPAGTVPLAPGAATPGAGEDDAGADEASLDFGPAAGAAAALAGGVAAYRRGKEYRGVIEFFDGKKVGPVKGTLRGAESLLRQGVRNYGSINDARGAASEGLARVIKGINRDKISRGVVSAFRRPNAADEIYRELAGIADTAPNPVVPEVPDVDVQRQRAAMKGSVEGTPPTTATAAEEGTDFLSRTRKILASEAGETAVGTLKQGAKVAGKLAPVVGVAAEAAYWGERLADDRRDTQGRHEDNYHQLARAFMDSERTQELFNGDITPAEFHDNVKALTIESDNDYFTDEEAWDLYQQGVKVLHSYYARQRGE